MFGRKTKEKIEQLEARLAYPQQSIDSRDNEYSLRCQVQRLEGQLELLIDSLGLVRVNRVIDRYEKKGGPEPEQHAKEMGHE